MRKGFKGFTVIVAILLMLGQGITFAKEKVKLRVLSHRYPALEFYVAEMGKSVEGVDIEAKFMPYNQVVEFTRIALSGGKVSPYEIVFAIPSTVVEYAANGWLEPLDPYIKKYKESYNFDDILPSVWDACTYQGHVYALPVDSNGLFFFYRKDLFDKHNLKPPKTFDQFLEAAKIIQKNESMYGTTLTFKPPVHLRDDFHTYLLGYGGRWFDEKNKPVFNGPEGIKGLTMMKELMKYAPPGVLSYSNDESMVSLQQGKVGMGIQWFTRASSMDDTKVSQVLGKIDFAAPPSGKEGEPGHTELGGAFYAIPKNVAPDVDKDIVFRVIAGAIDEESMRKGAKYSLPVRKSILQNPGDVGQRWWPAALRTLESAKPLPKIPKFSAMDEKITYYLSKALAGEIGIEEALNKAAAEAKEILERR